MGASDIIIAVSGKMQHGKDTVGDYLISNYKFKRLSFAEKVKEICMGYDNSTPELRDIWNKRIATEVLGDPKLAGEVDASMQRVQPGVWQKLTYEECYITKPDHARVCMQQFATDEMRRLDPDCWVRCALQKYEQEGGRRVITDMRFMNEAWAISALENSQIWRVERDMVKAGIGNNHVSETELDSFPFEVVIPNDGAIEDLHKRIDSLMRALLRGNRPLMSSGEVY